MNYLKNKKIIFVVTIFFVFIFAPVLLGKGHFTKKECYKKHRKANYITDCKRIFIWYFEVRPHIAD